MSQSKHPGTNGKPANTEVKQVDKRAYNADKYIAQFRIPKESLKRIQPLVYILPAILNGTLNSYVQDIQKHQLKTLDTDHIQQLKNLRSAESFGTLCGNIMKDAARNNDPYTIGVIMALGLDENKGPEIVGIAREHNSPILAKMISDYANMEHDHSSYIAYTCKGMLKDCIKSILLSEDIKSDMGAANMYSIMSLYMPEYDKALREAAQKKMQEKMPALVRGHLTRQRTTDIDTGKTLVQILTEKRDERKENPATMSYADTIKEFNANHPNTRSSKKWAVATENGGKVPPIAAITR